MKTEPPPGAVQVMAEVGRFVEAWGYPPSIRQLATELGLSAAGVKYHLDALRDLGMVTWEPGQSRTVRLTADGERAIR